MRLSLPLYLLYIIVGGLECVRSQNIQRALLATGILCLENTWRDDEGLREGLELELEWGGGTLLYLDETTEWQPIEIAEFWGGTALFDEASPVEGAAVTGSFSTGIYTWQEVEG